MLSLTSPMTLKQTFFTVLLIACVSSISYSQTNNKVMDVNKDIDVVQVYEQVVREGYGTPFIYKHLAIAYYYNSEYSKAITWFQKLFSVEKNTDPELDSHYRQALNAVAAANLLKSKKNIY